MASAVAVRAIAKVAATPLNRSILNCSVRQLNALPSSPIRFPPGTRTRSNEIVPLLLLYQESPGTGSTLTPALAASISNRLKPPGPCATGAGNGQYPIGTGRAGDQRLLATDQEVVTISICHGRKPGNVRTAARFGNCKCDFLFPGKYRSGNTLQEIL